MIATLPNLRDLPGRLDELRRSGVALVIIDTPPAITAAIPDVMRVADLVVMPVRSSPHDLEAIAATIDLAHQAQARFVFALTQPKLNARVTPQAAALLSVHGTVASSIIQDRVIYASAMTDGRTVTDFLLGMETAIRERRIVTERSKHCPRQLSALHVRVAYKLALAITFTKACVWLGRSRPGPAASRQNRERVEIPIFAPPKCRSRSNTPDLRIDPSYRQRWDAHGRRKSISFWPELIPRTSAGHTQLQYSASAG